MTTDPNGNGLTRTLRSRVLYAALLVFFALGALAGWFITEERHTCERLVAEQRRLVVTLDLLARSAREDGARRSADTLAAYATAAKQADYPRC